MPKIYKSKNSKPQLVLHQKTKKPNPNLIPKTQYLNRRKRHELQRTLDKKEDEDGVPVAPKNFGHRHPGLGLNLVAVDARELQEDHRERDDGVDEEEQDSVVAVEEVVRLVGRVAEPQGLRVCQVSPHRGGCLLQRLVLQHSRWSCQCSWRLTSAGRGGHEPAICLNTREFQTTRPPTQEEITVVTQFKMLTSSYLNATK